MKILSALALALALSGIASAATLEDDTNRYVQIFSDSRNVDVRAVEALAWTGISDPRVFDPVERWVLNNAEQGMNDTRIRKQVSLYIRALGFSGQPKYLGTLDRMSSEQAYRRYALKAMEDMPDYQKWNPVISDRASFDPKYSDEVNRILNMLHSDDFALKKIGAKRVYESNRDAVLLDTLAEQIRTTYTTTDERMTDTVAWMVKALGSAKQSKYLPLLDEVASNARDRSIVRHARNGLER